MCTLKLNIKIAFLFSFLWVSFAIINTDLDQADKNQCGSESTTLILG
jgi:hypothetical protein